jgi:hypothetical protein
MHGVYRTPAGALVCSLPGNPESDPKQKSLGQMGATIYKIAA